MSKIICDICGTTYPDTAPSCPICGCTRDAAASLLGEELLSDEIAEEPKGRGGRFSSKKKKEIFDFDEVNTGKRPEPPREEEPYEEEEEYEEAPRHNTGAVILLTILIAVLLLAAGYLLVRYFLPNQGGQDETVPSESQTLPTTETTANVPCQNLLLLSGEAKLTSQGGQYLINVVRQPEDCTEKLLCRSADESVATVDENGLVTAVGEGTTEIYIVCGTQEVRCPVTCSFEPEETPATEPETAPPATDENGETVATEGEAETEETQPTVNPDVKLKLKKTDISLGVYYEFQLLLDCNLEQNAVQWSVEHPNIVSVDEEGNIKALKYGTTSVTAKYGDQEVSCIVRCS